MRLELELVPKSCWYSNVRSNVSPRTWEDLRQRTFLRAGGRCLVCGKHDLECHEVWEYDDRRAIQRLVRLDALCHRCHRIKHFGFSLNSREARDTLAWFVAINQCAIDNAIAHIVNAFRVFEVRSAFEWRLDLTLLTRAYGIQLDHRGREAGADHV
ncbi:hypothetical protein [Burkholderia stagnalis]|uniref:hypothetical protein n=1 Tax=Burkholderia stagnalis TaxID=1503054 RepID=UPI000F575AFC|nr:hypothetical protein [Burkholderia stagnalis]